MVDLTAGFPEGNPHSFAHTSGKIHVTAIAENPSVKDKQVLGKKTKYYPYAVGLQH